MKNIKKLIGIILCASLLILAVGCGNDTSNLSGTHKAVMKIKEFGSITLELDADTAPITVSNFVKLAKEGFYDGLTFHRVMDGFMIQGGDPQGTGQGGSDTTIKGEFSANGVENNIKHERGVISMARLGHDYDSATSQFFIVHKTSDGNSMSLDGQYAAFGRVVEGIEVVDKIVEACKQFDEYVEPDSQPIIESVKIIEE